jgi:integral membrane protein (TIGR01906 family)
MKIIKKLVLFLLALSFPVLTVTTSIRIALSPLYINVEYNLPGFPPDEYGFSTADRLQWGQYSIDYLLGKVPQSEFSIQTLPDGSSLFNQREIAHMLDVRNLTAPVLLIWKVLLGFFMIMFLFSLWGKWSADYLKALRDGARLTILLIIMILFSVWLNFDLLFTKFHQLFFTGDTWLFYYTDDLIRLFPMRFWRDLFIFIGALTIIFSAIPILLWRRYLRKVTVR